MTRDGGVEGGVQRAEVSSLEWQEEARGRGEEKRLKGPGVQRNWLAARLISFNVAIEPDPDLYCRGVVPSIVEAVLRASFSLDLERLCWLMNDDDISSVCSRDRPVCPPLPRTQSCSRCLSSPPRPRG
jgi:hypothetical protein